MDPTRQDEPDPPVDQGIAGRRAAGQLLNAGVGRAALPVLQHLVAVQAQDLRLARLALRVRVPGLASSDLDRALTVDRSMVVGWTLRGTLHLVAAADYRRLLALTARSVLVSTRRRLGEEGVSTADAERAVPLLTRELAADGPLGRPELADRLAGEGVPTRGQAMPHLLRLAALQGVIVLGPVYPDGQRWVLADDWLGPAPADADRAAALAELAGRYRAAHHAAGPADLAGWAGVSLTDARTGWAASDPAGGGDDGGAGDAVDLDLDHPPRLLSGYDPYLLGWRDRSFAVPPAARRLVHPGGGTLRAVAVVRGRVVGTWSRFRGRPQLAPFDPLGAAVTAALEAEADDVVRFESS